MAERSGGLGHIVTPANRLARIAHDPQHVCQRQLARCGCFLPHLLVCTAGCSLGPASPRPFSTVSVHRAIDGVENRGAVHRYTDHIVPQCGTTRNRQTRARSDFVNRERSTWRESRVLAVARKLLAEPETSMKILQSCGS